MGILLLALLTLLVTPVRLEYVIEPKVEEDLTLWEAKGKQIYRYR